MVNQCPCLFCQHCEVECINIMETHCSFIFWVALYFPVNPVDLFLILNLSLPIFSEGRVDHVTQCLQYLEKAHRIGWDSLCGFLSKFHSQPLK